MLMQIQWKALSFCCTEREMPMKKFQRGRPPPYEKRKKGVYMKTAEKACRILFVLLTVTGALLLFLPYRGIRVEAVLSGSMETDLKTGGVIFTDVSRRDPEPGDIITYRIGDTDVTHRVVRKEKENYITKGDANDKEDMIPVKRSQITGTVIGTIPALGYLAVFLRQKTIFTILAIMMIQETIFGLIRWKGERREKLRRKLI